MSDPGLVIYADPVGGAALYAGLPPPGLILDHPRAPRPFRRADPGGAGRRQHPAPHQPVGSRQAARGPEGPRHRHRQRRDHHRQRHRRSTAIPAYNTTADRLQYHPKGRDNGYVLTVGGQRVYIAGDTEDIPEMRALERHRHRLRADEPALHHDASSRRPARVAAFQPGFVYPYHYGEQRHRRVRPAGQRVRRPDRGGAARLVPDD